MFCNYLIVIGCFLEQNTATINLKQEKKNFEIKVCACKRERENHTPITHIGNVLIPSSHSTLHLNSVLRVPSIASNIASTHKICHDNKCWCYFDENFLSIQAFAMRKVVYQGKSESGVYLIYSHKASQLSLSSKACNSVARLDVFNESLWHMRLGHPHDQVLKILFPNAKLVMN